MDLKALIKARAAGLGLDLVGIAAARPLSAEHARRLRVYLSGGAGNLLPFMGRNIWIRLNPQGLMPGARSIIVAGLAFKPHSLPPAPAGTCAGRVALYALYRDYHQVLRRLLTRLARYLNEVSGTTHAFRVGVDSGPILERTLAVTAGLGFICSNQMLAHPALGPALFLGEIITTLPLEPDPTISGRCLGCNRCAQVCPTGAIQPRRPFDVTRCLNTWTIEHRGPIPADIASMVRDRVYGCDECILACPLYEQAPPCCHALVGFDPERRWLDLNQILAMTEEDFRTRFSGTVIRRLGLRLLQRNALICLQNLGRA